MSSVQRRGESFRLLFRHAGRQHSLTLGKVSEAEAEAKSSQVDYFLMRLKQGLVMLPPGCDVVEFVRHDGRPPVRTVEAPSDSPTLEGLRDRYLAAHAAALEANTLSTARIHFGHLMATLGEDTTLKDLSQDDLQGHVDRRMIAVTPYTARKEVGTLRSAWNWAMRVGLVDRPFPIQGLVYPKGEEPLPFRTRAEIQREIKLGRLRGAEAGILWHGLYLQADEVAGLLGHAKEHGGHPWVYPLICTAAHTGARRGELIRMRLGDVDLDAGTLLIRERKRVKGTRTTRRAPLTAALADALREWLAIHPGGDTLFRHAETVPRSRTRGPRARRAAVAGSLTVSEVHHHFRRTFAGSEWEVVRGAHVLRHSFASCMAAAGVDQRVIDSIMGHSSEAMRRRYRHLAPSVAGQAVRDVFG